MWTEPDDKAFELTKDELSVLRRAAKARNRSLSDSKAAFTKGELIQYGIVREAFDRSEMLSAGITSSLVTSRDKIVKDAMDRLGVGSPHPTKIGKWQLPIDMSPFRPVMIVFPPGSKMARKTQPVCTPSDPGGALRIVLSGRLSCNGEWFGPGEWFFVPNGISYEMASDESDQTSVLYIFRFPSSESGGRFAYEEN